MSNTVTTNTGRLQLQFCVSVLLLTVLFFLPFFQLWVSVKILLLLGVLYAFLFVPLIVGLVKHNLTEQQIVISRLKWNIR